MPTDEAAQQSMEIVQYQEFRAPRARLRWQFTDGSFDESFTPPPPNPQDESMASLVVVAWQDWCVLPARLQSVQSGAFDDSSGGPPPPPEPDTAWWQSPRPRLRPWARRRDLYQNAPWDGDGPAPPPITEGPGSDFQIIQFQQWQAPLARRLQAFTGEPQDLDAFTQPTPDQSMVVLPWFTGRVPMEQIRNLYWAATPTGDTGAAPDLFLNEPPFIAGRTPWRGTRWNLRARLAQQFATTAQDVTGPTPLGRGTYIPTTRARRR